MTKEEAIKLIEEKISMLKAKKANMRCSELCEHLKYLGFSIRDGKKGGHKIYTHSELKDFTADNFNCGHDRNSTVNKVYPQNVAGVISWHKEDLAEVLIKRGKA